MKNALKQSVLTLVLLLTSYTTQADVLVLIHGWAANANTWIQSGVVPTLEQAGWHYAGVVTIPDNQAVLVSARKTSGNNTLYLANLQAEAPLLVQAGQLLAELNYIRLRHPDQKLILAAHSAGGVVARLALVHKRAPQVEKLVSIATPNLGTPRALDGLDVTDSKPFFCPGPGVDFMKSVLGGNDYDYLKVSRAALVDLAPARAGSLIAWLNVQAHPDLAYHAIIHLSNQYGDGVVPAYSQDLNHVKALTGKAQVHVLASGHRLSPADGQELLAILMNP